MTFSRSITTKDGRFEKEVVECRTYGGYGAPPAVLMRTVGSIRIGLETENFDAHEMKQLATELLALCERSRQ